MTTKPLAKRETGTVLSRKQDKTAVVSIEKFETHPLYRKRIRRAKKVYAHDEKNEVQAGDTVLISESRPLSKLKRWRVVKILERSKVSQEKILPVE